MFKAIKNFYGNICEKGLRIPFAFDSVTKQPSITLFFAYVTFVVMMLSLIGLHVYKQILQATLLSVLVWVLAVVFYKFKEFDRFKINLKDQSVDLEDTPDVKPDNNEEGNIK